MNLGAIEKKLGLGGIFSSFNATSNFERREEVRGTGTNPRESRTTTDAWRPFFQCEASLKNGWRTTFSTDRTSTRSESNSGGLATTGVTTDRTNESYRLGLAKSLGGGRRTNNTGSSRNTIDLNFDVTYARDASVTVRPSQPGEPVVTRNDNFQGRFSTSYRFTSTVSGTMQLSVGQRRDLQTEQTDRNIGLQATAGISF
jgi:hypothetical protein